MGMPLPAGGVLGLDLIGIFSGPPPETSLEFDPFMQKWFVLSIPFMTPHLQIRLADTPIGPWSSPATIYEIPPPWSLKPTFSYSPKHHRELTARSGELMVTFMSNNM